MDKHKSLLKDEYKGIFVYTANYANHLYVEVPYNKDFIAEVKTLGARWVSKSKRWLVNEGHKEDVCALLDKFFNTSLRDKYLSHKQASLDGAAKANMRSNNE